MLEAMRTAGHWTNYGSELDGARIRPENLVTRAAGSLREKGPRPAVPQTGLKTSRNPRPRVGNAAYIRFERTQKISTFSILEAHEFKPGDAAETAVSTSEPLASAPSGRSSSESQ